jgi:hypothetical protein
MSPNGAVEAVKETGMVPGAVIRHFQNPLPSRSSIQLQKIKSKLISACIHNTVRSINISAKESPSGRCVPDKKKVLKSGYAIDP